MTTEYSISQRIGANRYSRRSVICLRLKYEHPEIARTALKSALDELCSIEHSRDLGIPTTFHDLESRRKGATELELTAILALFLLRKTGVYVEQAGHKVVTNTKENLCWFEISDVEQGRVAAETAVNVVDNLVSKSKRQQLSDGEILTGLLTALDRIDAANPFPHTALFISALDKRNVQWRPFKILPLHLELGLGAKTKWFHQSFSENESFFSFVMSQNKKRTAEYLKTFGISVPNSLIADSLNNALKASTKLKTPLVVKPASSGGSRGVTVNVADKETFIKAFHVAKKYDSNIIVEEYVEGDVYRILVIDRKVASCTKRIRAHVVGDGVKTIRELCIAENSKGDRGNKRRHERKIIPIDELDSNLTSPYKTMGYTLDSIPAENEIVRLSYTRVAAGGESENATEKMHPDFIKLAEYISELIGLKACGLDIITPDISKTISSGSYWVNEVNNHPTLASSEFPDLANSVAEMLVSSIFPDDKDWRIPVVLVISNEDCSEVIKALALSLDNDGIKAVAAHRYGYDACGLELQKGNFANLRGSQIAYADRSAETIILERCPNELDDFGLGIDRPDVIIFEPTDKKNDWFWLTIANEAEKQISTFIMGATTELRDNILNCYPDFDLLKGEPSEIAAVVKEKLKGI